MTAPTYRCLCCGRGAREGELVYYAPADEYWCEDCVEEDRRFREEVDADSE